MAVFMGIVYKASPGPVNIETLRRGTSDGSSAALAVQLGSLVGHLVYAPLAIGGISIITNTPFVRIVLSSLSVLLLLYLGFSAIRGRHALTQNPATVMSRTPLF